MKSNGPLERFGLPAVVSDLAKAVAYAELRKTIEEMEEKERWYCFRCGDEVDPDEDHECTDGDDGDD